MNLNLDTAGVLRLGLAITQNPVQSPILVGGIVGFADIPVPQDLDLVILGWSHSVVKVAIDTHITFRVEHDLLLVI